MLLKEGRNRSFVGNGAYSLCEKVRNANLSDIVRSGMFCCKGDTIGEGEPIDRGRGNFFNGLSC